MLIPSGCFEIIIRLGREPETKILDRPIPVLTHQFQDDPRLHINPFVKALIPAIVIHPEHFSILESHAQCQLEIRPIRLLTILCD